MNYDVIVTCAVTGAGDTRAKNPHVPVTPQEVADSAIAAAKAGAARGGARVGEPVPVLPAAADGGAAALRAVGPRPDLCARAGRGRPATR